MNGITLEPLRLDESIIIPQEVPKNGGPQPNVVVSTSNGSMNPNSMERLLFSSSMNLHRLKMLGRGSSATVYASVLLPSMKICAEKVVAAGDNQRRLQLARELASLQTSIEECENNPGANFIVKMLGSFSNQRDGTLSVCLEYLDGGSLQDIIDLGGCHNERVLIGIAHQMLCGLDFLHRVRIIHRDLKPSNTLYSSTGTIKLADFGLSRTLEVGQLAESFIGTFDYMAPERILGQPYSFISDIWSFGLSILALALGHYPFASGDSSRGYWTLLHMIQDIEVPKLPSNKFTIEFQDFVARSCQKDATIRWTSRALLDHVIFVPKTSVETNPTEVKLPSSTHSPIPSTTPGVTATNSNQNIPNSNQTQRTRPVSNPRSTSASRRLAPSASSRRPIISNNIGKGNSSNNERSISNNRSRTKQIPENQVNVEDMLRASKEFLKKSLELKNISALSSQRATIASARRSGLVSKADAAISGVATSKFHSARGPITAKRASTCEKRDTRPNETNTRIRSNQSTSNVREPARDRRSAVKSQQSTRSPSCHEESMKTDDKSDISLMNSPFFIWSKNNALQRNTSFVFDNSLSITTAGNAELVQATVTSNLMGKWQISLDNQELFCFSIAEKITLLSNILKDIELLEPKLSVDSSYVFREGEFLSIKSLFDTDFVYNVNMIAQFVNYSVYQILDILKQTINEKIRSLQSQPEESVMVATNPRSSPVVDLHVMTEDIMSDDDCGIKLTSGQSPKGDDDLKNYSLKSSPTIVGHFDEADRKSETSEIIEELSFEGIKYPVNRSHLNESCDEEEVTEDIVEDENYEEDFED